MNKAPIKSTQKIKEFKYVSFNMINTMISIINKNRATKLVISK